MTNIRRLNVPDNLYFITCVTSMRIPVLVENIDLMWQAIKAADSKINFDLDAWVFLPEHFHLMINPKSNSISKVLQSMKLSFSMNYRKMYPLGNTIIWQRRFWDHIIRDEEDYNRHLDYIHINPVKHNYVKSAFDWPHSSIHKFKEYYQEDWGCLEDIEIKGSFGE